MKEYVIPEDRGRILFYTLLYFLLMAILILTTLGFYAINWYLTTFILFTVLWFDVKAMLRYGRKLFRKTPVCELKANEVVIHSLPGKAITLTYKQIDEVKLLKGRFSLKFFFGGKEVEHPSGWYYIGVVYPFKKKQLIEVENKVTECLKEHGIAINKVDKK